MIELQRISCFVALTIGSAVLVGCSSAPRVMAPVEDRIASSRTGAGVVDAAAAPVKVLPGAENAGKPGYYTVQRGETLTRIGLEHGQSKRDLTRWNNLSNPDVIEVGQVLRVAPPGAAVEASGVVVRPVTSSAEMPAATTSTKPAPVNPPAAVADEGLGFIWPSNGTLIGGFDESKNKGLDIAGKAGDAVMASADGQVVYAGAGLRGYGNLIILKHNNTFLTAYAHNQKLLVKEDQKVRKGEKIAEMGNTDADRVKLHFEVRRQGKPVDPAKFLPAR
ncbi:peptidase M23 [Limnohabitans sp. MMS-10A-160]|uniref:peptidoglycan DD-metalloendopeptidase family protein n=1 Tax=unclassified Limnohabitans TaxID=2626134 RepID=UPI000D363E07|nr:MULTISPECIES: peptidoglycan DD-metalloendopeptidase family protein [unclassified Limnohabitans]PUE22548.1 peptidase M23 [Limnohabitans sp. MMS-10A-192]PUE26139.1 peptidase M23 [Limnohabitans sp. MMS-10A-160]